LTKGKPLDGSKSLPAKIEEVPEELSPVWDDKIAEAFKGLNPKQQTFLIKYVSCWNGAEAYRTAYNPLAGDHLAASLGSRLIANDDISLILAKFADNKTEALFLVQKTYTEAATQATKPIFGKDELGQPVLVMDVPDHAVRVKAADSIAKLHGLNAPAEVKHEVTSRVQIVELPPKDKP
jgi:hypothetical protein